MADDERTGTGGAGTAPASGGGSSSRQGSRKRSSSRKKARKSTSSRSRRPSESRSKFADDSSKPTDPAKVAAAPPRNVQNVEGVSSNWPGGVGQSTSDALVGHFAIIAEGEYAGLYGVVQDVVEVGDHGAPKTARFEVRSRPESGVDRPETPDGTITVPWENLRRSVAGLR